MSGEDQILRVRVTGRVQGVAFRAWTKAEATRLGILGWVRNETDGSVAALVAGPSPAVSAMLDALRRGPPAARVDDISVEPGDPADLRDGFRIIR